MEGKAESFKENFKGIGMERFCLKTIFFNPNVSNVLQAYGLFGAGLILPRMKGLWPLQKASLIIGHKPEISVGTLKSKHELG